MTLQKKSIEQVSREIKALKQEVTMAYINADCENLLPSEWVREQLAAREKSKRTAVKLTKAQVKELRA